MKKNVKKYIALSNKAMRQLEKVEKYESFYGFNAIRADSWRTRYNTTCEEIEKLEEMLSSEEKEGIEEYYQCQIFE